MQLYWIHLLTLKIFWQCLWVCICSTCHLQIYSSTSSFPTWILFISFSFLTALVRTSTTKLNRSCENKHLFYFWSLGKYWLLPVSMMLAVVFLYMPFLRLRMFPSIPNLLIIFIMKGCQIFFKYFLCMYWDDHMAFILYSTTSYYSIFRCWTNLHSWDKS